MKINIFWFRRDLRLKDNKGLWAALSSDLPVLPLFIFDSNIISELAADDSRITFIYESLSTINRELNLIGSSLFITKGDPSLVWKELLASFDINAVYSNKDYEPYSVERDKTASALFEKHNIPLHSFKDQVIHEEGEILKPDNKPYTIFTPYKRAWLKRNNEDQHIRRNELPIKKNNFYKKLFGFPSLKEIGFATGPLKVRKYDLSAIGDYDKQRDIPYADRTSYLGPHLRFGTVSIREITSLAFDGNPVFLNELIWREFFMQILFNFPYVVTENFRTKYDNIQWRNNDDEFEKWCKGETGYPIVDAGMHQLNETGYMHNRVRMISAGFLCKHLLIDWRWGEAYFAEKLLDYELASNNGNWQWAAGTGCDAAPWFRIFNPYIQQKKFDTDNLYVEKWCRNFKKPEYPEPIVNHDFAYKRAIITFRKGIK